MAYIENSGKTALDNNTVYTIGKKFSKVDARAEVLSTAKAADVVILCGGLTADVRIARLNSYSFGALDNACDLGFYKKENGEYKVVDGDVLLDGVDLSTAGTAFEDILLKNASLDRTKTVGDLLGVTAESIPASGYFLGLKIGAAPAANSTLEWEVELEQPTSK